MGMNNFLHGEEASTNSQGRGIKKEGKTERKKLSLYKLIFEGFPFSPGTGKERKAPFSKTANGKIMRLPPYRCRSKL
jgi:hypothetical protein